MKPLSWRKVSSEKRWSLAAGQSPNLFSVGDGGMVFRSTDEGATWANIGKNQWSYLTSDENPTAVAVGPDGKVFLHTSSGWLFLFNHESNTWEPLNKDPLKGTFASDRENHLFVIANGLNIVQSNDGGKTWAKATFALPFLGVPREPLHPLGSPFLRSPLVAFGGKGEIFIEVQGAGMYGSSDKGVSWKQLNPLTNLGRDSSINCIVTDAVGTVFLCTNKGILASTNSGLSWTSIGLDDQFVEGLAVGPGGTLFAGTHESIWKAAMERQSTAER